ncbi:hypothetical protein EDD22DRAFT_860519 [Suillus occidentalis]|nr:hypothetical protein EDD22DRAFT_860519 [Suillus occidentalis]
MIRYQLHICESQSTFSHPSILFILTSLFCWYARPFVHACHVSSSGLQCAIELDGQHLLLIPPADLRSISKHLQLFRDEAHA